MHPVRRAPRRRRVHCASKHGRRTNNCHYCENHHFKPQTGYSCRRLHEASKVTLQLWDVAGQYRNVNLIKAFYKGAHGAMVVCEVTREQSLADAALWRETLLDLDIKVPGTTVRVPAFLIVNKIDTVPDRRKISDTFSPAALDRFCGERADSLAGPMPPHSLWRIATSARGN